MLQFIDSHFSGLMTLIYISMFVFLLRHTINAITTCFIAEQQTR